MDIILLVQKIVIACWEVLLEASVFLLFGFFSAGIIYVLIPRNKVFLHLGESNFLSSVKAAFFGVPLPLCSCGVIPAVAELRNKGASKSASLSFLISVPETGIDSIALSYTLLDPILTVMRPVVAFFTATIAGTLSAVLEEKETKHIEEDYDCIYCGDCLFCHPHSHSLKTKTKVALHYGFFDLLSDLAPSLTIGIFLAGLISTIIPETLITSLVGGGLQSLIIMLLIGIPLYICATSSTPVVASLIAKGMSPGAGLVFLLAGPCTNMVTLTTVNKYFGKKSLAIYLFSIAMCSIGAGLLVDHIYVTYNINAQTSIGHVHHHIPHNLEVVSAFLLLGLLTYGIYKEKFTKKSCGLSCCDDGKKHHLHINEGEKQSYDEVDHKHHNHRNSEETDSHCLCEDS